MIDIQRRQAPIANAAINKKNQARLLSFLAVSLFIVILSCFALFVFWRLRPQIAETICYPQIAQKIGVEPTYRAISQYVKEKIQPGMTLEEGLDNLRQITDVGTSSQALSSGEMREYVSITICPYTFTGLYLLVQYEASTREVLSVYEAYDNW